MCVGSFLAAELTMDVVVKRKRVLCRSIYCWMQSVTVCCCFTGVRQLAHAASILCATVPAHSPMIVVVPSSSISKWSAMAAEIVYIPFQSSAALPRIPGPLRMRRRARFQMLLGQSLHQTYAVSSRNCHEFYTQLLTHST
jgi:hypothetical protein